MKTLITGGCGFLGSNLAEDVIEKGEELFIFDSLSSQGSAENLEWLRGKGPIGFTHGDIRNAHDVEQTVKSVRPDVVWHLAGQVAMVSSLDNPRKDFEINAAGTLNLLEAVRRWSPDAAVIYSSTNKVYGDLEWVRYAETVSRYVAVDYPDGFNETLPLSFHSPYGCSKGTGDQYMLDYARMYNLRTVVFRHSSMYGERQFPTANQGWVGWFCRQALLQKHGADEPFTISGSGKQVRDVLHSDDMAPLYRAAVSQIDAVKGKAFNIGGGMERSLSLLELFKMLEDGLGVKPRFRQVAPRESDQRVFVANLSNVERLLRWRPAVSLAAGINRMLAWISKLQAAGL